MQSAIKPRKLVRGAAERFWSKVNKSGDCWLWEAAKQKEYGWFWHNGQGVAAHRFSWMMHYDEIPEGLHVLHKCDVKLCVNPNHLFLGTHQDNMKDLMEKRRIANDTIPIVKLPGHTSLDDVLVYCNKHNLRPTINCETKMWVLRPMPRRVK